MYPEFRKVTLGFDVCKNYIKKRRNSFLIYAIRTLTREADYLATNRLERVKVIQIEYAYYYSLLNTFLNPLVMLVWRTLGVCQKATDEKII